MLQMPALRPVSSVGLWLAIGGVSARAMPPRSEYTGEDCLTFCCTATKKVLSGLGARKHSDFARLKNVRILRVMDPQSATSTIKFLDAGGRSRELIVSGMVRAWVDRVLRLSSEGALDAEDLIEQILACIDMLFGGVAEAHQKVLMELLLVLIRDACANSEGRRSPEDAMIPCAQAALEIGAHISSIRQAAQTGRVSAIKGGNTWYVRRGDLRNVRPRTPRG